MESGCPQVPQERRHKQLPPARRLPLPIPGSGRMCGVQYPCYSRFGSADSVAECNFTSAIYGSSTAPAFLRMASISVWSPPSGLMQRRVSFDVPGIDVGAGFFTEKTLDHGRGHPARDRRAGIWGGLLLPPGPGLPWRRDPGGGVFLRRAETRPTHAIPCQQSEAAYPTRRKSRSLASQIEWELVNRKCAGKLVLPRPREPRRQAASITS